jgi:hypothetical protein
MCTVRSGSEFVGNLLGMSGGRVQGAGEGWSWGLVLHSSNGRLKEKLRRGGRARARGVEIARSLRMLGEGGASDGKIKRRFVGKFCVILKKFMRNISWLLEEKTGVLWVGG